MADSLSKELAVDNHTPAADHNDEKARFKSDPSDADADTVHDGDRDYEKGGEAQRTSSRNSAGLAHTHSGVDVEQAQRDFAELSKQFSAHSRRMSKVQSHTRASIARDVEKAVSSEATSDDTWDLEETLRGAKQADYEAGIKSKYIGKPSIVRSQGRG